MTTSPNGAPKRRGSKILFDQSTALADGAATPQRTIESFLAYMARGGHAVSWAEFEENLAAKMQDRRVAADIGPLLAHGRTWDLEAMV